MSIKRLSWAQFEVANPDKEVAFEDLCRSLFNKMYFDAEMCIVSDSPVPGCVDITGAGLDFSGSEFAVGDIVVASKDVTVQ